MLVCFVDPFPVFAGNSKPRVNTANESFLNVETNSVNEFHDGRQTGYSAHRENMQRDRMIKDKYVSAEQV